MPGIHHPTAPADPVMLEPHPRESCERERCGLPPWRAEDQSLYRQGYAAAVADFLAAGPIHCPDCGGGLYCPGVPMTL